MTEMLKKIHNLLFNFRAKNAIAGSLVPIVRTCKYNSNLSSEQIKNRLTRDMLNELMNYVVFSEEEKENGVILLSARLDVWRWDNAEQRSN